jgi:hypothetical protein
MAYIELIYCASGNRRYDDIAVRHGFHIGAQLPGRTIYHPIFFVDQNWKRPCRSAYMQALAAHRPAMATVLDLERPSQIAEVLGWAEDAAAYTSCVLIIPKYGGAIAGLPRKIAGAAIRLGYSVPTSHGGTEVWAGEFIGWPIHLLGGSPHRQMEIARYLDVRSADGNMHNKMSQRCKYWQAGRWHQLQSDALDANYAAFDRSCQHIAAAWAQTLTQA